MDCRGRRACGETVGRGWRWLEVRVFIAGVTVRGLGERGCGGAGDFGDDDAKVMPSGPRFGAIMRAE